LIGRSIFGDSKIIIKRKHRSIIIFSHGKWFFNIYTPTKPPKNSHMMLEENEDLENKVSQLKNQVNDITDSMLKMMDFSHYQEIFKMEMEYKMENLMD
jgi:hypothetical protein